MFKAIAGFLVAVVLVAFGAWKFAGGLMFNEFESPFGLEETVARIQHNILKVEGWELLGLKSPSNSIKAKGATIPNVLMIETCNTDYSKPILKERDTRILSILMPCKVTVYETEDGKVHIGMMNAGLMGQMFGPVVADIMGKVAADQKKFIRFDPSQPAPELIVPKRNEGGGKGLQSLGGC